VAPGGRKGGGSHQGGCLTPGGNSGSFDERWGRTESECRRECELSVECVAYEHALINGQRSGGGGAAYTRCELHKDPVSDLMPLPGHVCFVKVSPTP